MVPESAQPNVKMLTRLNVAIRQWIDIGWFSNDYRDDAPTGCGSERARILSTSGIVYYSHFTVMKRLLCLCGNMLADGMPLGRLVPPKQW